MRKIQRNLELEDERRAAGIFEQFRPKAKQLLMTDAMNANILSVASKPFHELVVPIIKIDSELNFEYISAPQIIKPEDKKNTSRCHHISKSDISSTQPLNFAEVLCNIRTMRANRNAPVDSLGCEGIEELTHHEHK